MGSTNTGLKGLAASRTNQQGSGYHDSSSQTPIGSNWKAHSPHQAVQAPSTGGQYSRESQAVLLHKLPHTWKDEGAETRQNETSSKREREVQAMTCILTGLTLEF